MRKRPLGNLDDWEMHYEVDPLEQRVMMAGDVSVQLSGSGVLKVVGDNANNNLMIAKSGSNVIVIPRGGESINGGAVGATLDSGAVQLMGIVVRLRGGDDDFQIGRGDLAHDLDVGVKGVRLNMGQGTDIATMYDSRITGNVIVKMNQGNPGAIESFILISSNGESIDGNLKVTGNSFGDSVSVFNVFVGKRTRIATGSGEDLVELQKSYFAESTKVDLRSDDDTLLIVSNHFLASATLEGGRGNNNWINTNNFFTEPPVIRGF